MRKAEGRDCGVEDEIISIDTALLKKSISDAIAKKQAKPKSKPSLTIPLFQEWLDNKGITVRRNLLTHRLETSGLGTVYDAETLESSLHVILHDELKSEFSCSSSLVADLLAVVGGLHRYNPVIDFFKAAPPWDKTDYYEIVYQAYNLAPDDALSRVLIRKAFCQWYSLLYNNERKPYGGDGVLTLIGKQGCGKTRSIELLTPLPEYVKIGGFLNFADKDSYIRATSCWICELAEAETTLRTDRERLKSFLTSATDSYRLPYGRTDTNLIRRTSFVATANSNQLFIDETGNRRFWTIPIESVDCELLEKMDRTMLWKQIENDVMTYGWQCFRLSATEQKFLAERNGEHEKPLKAQSEVMDILSDAENNPAQWEWVNQTVTEFKEYNAALRPYTVEAIGQALTRIGINTQQARDNGKRTRVRCLPRRKYGG